MRDLLSLPRTTVVEFEALVKTRNQNDLIIKHGPMRILVQRESFWMGDRQFYGWRFALSQLTDFK